MRLHGKMETIWWGDYMVRGLYGEVITWWRNELMKGIYVEETTIHDERTIRWELHNECPVAWSRFYLLVITWPQFKIDILVGSFFPIARSLFSRSYTLFSLFLASYKAAISLMKTSPRPTKYSQLITVCVAALDI